MNNYNIEIFGFFAFLANDSIFFKDKSEIEKDLREIQRLEIKQKLEALKEHK